MKKLLIVFVSGIVLLFATSCMSSVKDGTYTAKAPQPDQFKSTPQATVTIENGKITKVDIDAITEDGTKKSELSKDGKYDMSPAGAQWPWHEQIATLDQYLVDNQGSKITSYDADGKTDALSGCTISIKEYVDVFNQAYGQAKK